MSTETRTRSEPVVPERPRGVVEPERDEALRALAVEEIRRLRAFRLLVVAACIAILIGGAVWALTEYYTAHTAHTWPSSFADATGDEPGVWSTWFFYFAGVWLAIVAIEAVRTYTRRHSRRPLTAAEIERELQRSTSADPAVEQHRSVGRFKRHLVVCPVGILVLAAIWVPTEYYEEHTWPSRFAEAPDVAGTWSPWFFWAAGAWLLVLALQGLWAYYAGPALRRTIRRPVPTEELERELARLKARASH